MYRYNLLTASKIYLEKTVIVVVSSVIVIVELYDSLITFIDWEDMWINIKNM